MSFLVVENLKKHFQVKGTDLFGRDKQVVKAVDGVSFRLERGKVLGLVGESGCGKSTLGRTMLRLLEPTEGRVLIDGTDVTTLKGEKLRTQRRTFQMIFQDPYASLDPRMTVFDTLAEPLFEHKLVESSQALNRVKELMDVVGLASRHIRKYPHEFSGGQRQRIAIARALALEPELIVADEPVSALDVSIQSQILNLLSDLREQLGLTMVFISHDLGVVKHVSDDLAVMYLGKIAEYGPTQEVFQAPGHPYTQALLSAIPVPDPDYKVEQIELDGDPPSPINPPSGCRFHPRCRYANADCAKLEPSLDIDSQRPAVRVACSRLDAVRQK